MADFCYNSEPLGSTENSVTIFIPAMYSFWYFYKIFTFAVLCYRILWKLKKDELKNTEANTDVTSHLAFAVVATIIMVKRIVNAVIVTEFFYHVTTIIQSFYILPKT